MKSYVVFCVRLWAVDFIYEPLFRSMSRRYDLWTVNFFYVPLFSSMCHRRFLCAFTLFYGPSARPMCRQRYPRLFLSFPMSPPLHSNFKSLKIPNRIIKYHAYI